MITLEEENKTENHEWEGIGNFPIRCHPIENRHNMILNIVF